MKILTMTQNLQSEKVSKRRLGPELAMLLAHKNENLCKHAVTSYTQILICPGLIQMGFQFFVKFVIRIMITRKGSLNLQTRR